MKLSESEARTLLSQSSHGVLATVHPTRGVDAVPVVFALDGGYIAIPIDTVKPKSATRLQRERNLEHDPRATLLVEHWDADDWSQLWWARAELRWESNPDTTVLSTLVDALAVNFPQYQDRRFLTVLILRVVTMSGWSATLRTPPPPA